MKVNAVPLSEHEVPQAPDPVLIGADAMPNALGAIDPMGGLVAEPLGPVSVAQARRAYWFPLESLT